MYIEDFLLAGVLTLDERVADIDASGSLQYTVNKYMLATSPEMTIKKIWYSALDDKTCAVIKEFTYSLTYFDDITYKI